MDIDATIQRWVRIFAVLMVGRCSHVFVVQLIIKWIGYWSPLTCFSPYSHSHQSMVIIILGCNGQEAMSYLIGFSCHYNQIRADNQPFWLKHLYLRPLPRSGFISAFKREFKGSSNRSNDPGMSFNIQIKWDNRQWYYVETINPYNAIDNRLLHWQE